MRMEIERIKHPDLEKDTLRKNLEQGKCMVLVKVILEKGPARMEVDWVKHPD